MYLYRFPLADRYQDKHPTDSPRVASGQESSYAKVDTGWLAALNLELDGRTIAQSGV